MDTVTKRLDYRQAYKLMEAKDEMGRPKPFDVRFVTLDGRVLTARGVICTSVDMKRGNRRIYFEDSKEWRWVYDILILSVNSTKIMMS